MLTGQTRAEGSVANWDSYADTRIIVALLAVTLAGFVGTWEDVQRQPVSPPGPPIVDLGTPGQ